MQGKADVEMGVISLAKPGGKVDEVDAADDWLEDGGSTVKNPSAGPSGDTAVAQGGDDWIVDAHAGAGGSSEDKANQKQGGPTGDGEHGAEAQQFGINDHDFWVGTSSAMMWLTYVMITVLIICVTWQFVMYQFETHVVAWTIGAVFVALAVPLSLQDIHMHIIHYISPLQRHYIRILWMVPIYSVESWLALRFNKQKVYLETLREAYEAFVVYSLYKLMREYMGDKPMAVARLAKVAERKGSNRATMLFPMCWSYKWRLDAQFLTRSSLGVWQYVFIRTALALTACILEMNHMYGEGSFAFNKFYVWNVIVLNLSQCWALWCLVMFYHELREELAPIKPLGKFMVVKAVVFFSWWQQIIVTYLASAEVIHPMMDYSGEDVAKGLQNLLICIEMLIYALFHKKFFSYTDFRAGGPLSSYMESMNLHQKHVKDAMHDMIPADVILEGASYVVKAKRLVDKKLHKDKDADKGPKAPPKVATAADAKVLEEVHVDIDPSAPPVKDTVDVPDLLMMEPASTMAPSTTAPSTAVPSTTTPSTTAQFTTDQPGNHEAVSDDEDDFEPGESINPFAEPVPRPSHLKADGDLLESD